MRQVFYSRNPDGTHNFLMDWDHVELPELKDSETAYKSKSGNWHILRHDRLTELEYKRELRARGADVSEILNLLINQNVRVDCPRNPEVKFMFRELVKELAD